MQSSQITRYLNTKLKSQNSDKALTLFFLKADPFTCIKEVTQFQTWLHLEATHEITAAWPHKLLSDQSVVITQWALSMLFCSSWTQAQLLKHPSQTSWGLNWPVYTVLTAD